MTKVMKKEKTILICENHPEEQIPLIWTFAFPGAEYWCPYCGYTGGMLGAGKEVPATPELIKKAKEWEKKGSKYLKAKGTFICSRLKYRGKIIKPSELPESYKEKLSKIDELQFPDHFSGLAQNFFMKITKFNIA